MIGPDDLIGVMTPEMSPSAITYSRKTASIEKAVTDTWRWARDSINAEYRRSKPFVPVTPTPLTRVSQAR